MSGNTAEFFAKRWKIISGGLSASPEVMTVKAWMLPLMNRSEAGPEHLP